ncbi:unnamed protein product [Gordionus sp. m RMFG-2023]|uniref:chromobox protein homolog 1-like n=1 Tax=Gordionus sp. m RMFG-2023 TaxID=3053472 RepID=UPI0030E5F3E9
MPKKKQRQSEELEPEEYNVEKIVEKRMKFGKVEYFIKWEGYPDSDNTWEPEENLDCPDLISEFNDVKRKSTTNESSNKRKLNGEESTPHIQSSVAITSTSGKRSRGKYEEEILRGFDRGLEPEKIIGATDSGGELMFLMKWKDSDEADLVPSRQANLKCPQIVIKFYEERLTWHTHSSAEEEETQHTSLSTANDHINRSNEINHVSPSEIIQTNVNSIDTNEIGSNMTTITTTEVIQSETISINQA